MRKMNNKKAKVWAVISSVALSSILAACGGESSGSQTNEGAGTGQIRIMSTFFSPTPPADDNPVKQEIEKATNTDLNIEWVSDNNYAEKLNVILASGDIPDLVFINDPFHPVFRNAANQGAFWDVSEFINDYPNIKAGISEEAWAATAIDGKNYGIPRPRPAEGESFFVVRQDWLDNLGLKAPTTTEELYKVMKAFTENDPDKNGKNDTIGMAGQVNPTDMGQLAEVEQSFTGAVGDWKETDDGKITYTGLLPEMKESLEFLHRAHQEKLIPTDFSSMQLTQVKDMFKAGEAGILEEKAGTMQEYYEALSQIDEKFDFKNLMPLTNINGYNPKGAGFSGLNAIPKTVPEEKVKMILAMVDGWMEEDVFKMHQQGIEGIHHTVENGEVVIDSDKVLADSIGDFNQIVYVSDPYASSIKPTFPEEVKTLYKEIQDEREKTSVSDISIGLYSETAQTYLPELKKQAQDLKTKIILGQEPLSAWDDFTASLKENQNFVAMTEELNKASQEKK